MFCENGYTVGHSLYPVANCLLWQSTDSIHCFCMHTEPLSDLHEILVLIMVFKDKLRDKFSHFGKFGRNCHKTEKRTDLAHQQPLWRISSE